MEKEKKKYPKLEELLPEGKHIITVKPHQEWKDGAFVEGTHKKGTSQFGNWYIYDTKVEDTWVSIFANDDNKEFFDSGTVEANIVPKRLKGMDNDLFDENGKKLLKAFYNGVKDEDKVVDAEEDKGTPVEQIEF